MIPISLTFNNLIFHPLLFITGACIVGIAWQHSHAYSLFVLLLLFILCALRVTELYKKSLLIALMLSAFCIGAFRLWRVHTNHMQWIEQIGTQPIDITATVTDSIPVDHPLYTQRLTLAIEQITTSSDVPIANQLLFFYTKHCPDITVADTITIRNIRIKKPSSLSFNNYLLKEGVAATVFAPYNNYTLVHRPTYSYIRWLYNLKNNTLRSLLGKMQAQSYHLFASLFLGNKPVPKKIIENAREHFNTWGVTHYLARSGLHMVIVAMVWQILLSFIPFSYTVRTMLLILLSIIYGLLSWPSVSFNRALMSFVLYKMCNLLLMPTHFLHVVTVVCLAVLIHNPMHLFFLDFQLSFGLTFALALFAHMRQKSPNY